MGSFMISATSVAADPGLNGALAHHNDAALAMGRVHLESTLERSATMLPCHATGSLTICYYHLAHVLHARLLLPSLSTRLCTTCTISTSRPATNCPGEHQ